ncbi:polyhomeotic-like protein 1 isoform X1 [Epinephelus moara]|uniref:polyhomeotic-like protein 1 isoform X1 n=1 Tax=Epinephelus moara TaxID=300413 RepID=UPI00214EA68F|nr:polyhomeotic-like protein 1 isoform X1 [Epinephelus moara]XP_049891195.1 polyhomeotic-like protein 1 isoform X1 [Epinephelus moara]
METDGEQNQQGASTNGSAASGTSSRPSPMNSMSLYERQAVQALQALQRQPNAAQYFQQLMLQQQINNAQLQNLAAVQQVKATLAASRQSSPSSSSSSQTTSTTAASVTSGSGSSTSSRPIGAPATSTISQSVLLSGTAGGQGQMYLRVNRSLRAPISSQLIFMPGNTATAAVATVTQQPQAQQQQQEVTPTSTSSSQSDNDQVQNLAMRGVSSPKGVGVKTEAPERSDSAAYPLVQPSHQSNSQSPTKPSQPPHIKIPTYPQPTNLKAHPSSSSGASSSTSSTSSIPLSQLLLHGTRTLTTGTTAPTAAHTLVLTSSAASQAHGYPVGTATIKPAVNAQTLVVQPLQKTSLSTEKSGHGNGPIPIQPKTLQGLRLPLQLPSRNPPPILPAPPPTSSSAQPPQPPHIPVQIVGARQSTLGNTQALALARGSCCQEGAAVLSSSSSLLTMVASIASREGGVVGRGVGLKTLQSPQEAPPLAQVSQVHPQANQSSGQSQNGPMASSPASTQAPTVSSPPSSMCRSSLSLPLVTEEQRASAGVTSNGDSSASQTPQGKQLTGSLKRKSDSNSANDEDGPSPPRLQPVRDHSSALLTNPIEAGSGAPPPASSSPSPVLSVSRGVCGQGERAPPPQAVVKPNVLTHLIEGFVIQEGAEPFPVCGSLKDSAGEDLTNDSPDTNQSETLTTATVLKCEYCKNFAPASQFRGTKRFCSMTCAKSMYWFPRYNVSFRQHFCMRQGQGQGQDHTPDQNQGPGHLSNSDEEGGITRRRVPRRTSSEIASAKIAGRPIPVKCRSESSHSDEESSGEEDEDDPMSLSPASSASCHQLPPPLPTESSAPSCLPASPAQWSVEDVSQFISSLQGCEELASQFLSQEIDGQALLLLKEEHLMSTMNIKLGPALKICAHINNLRD